MQRFNLSVRVDDNGNPQVELHDRYKRPLCGPPFGDNELGGGILTVQGRNIDDAAEVRDALNTLNNVRRGCLSPAVMRSALDVIETKRAESHTNLDAIMDEPWRLDDPIEGELARRY